VTPDDTAAFASLIDPAAELRCIGSGYQFTEGPVWNAAESCLYFSDIPGDTRWRWSEADGLQAVLHPTFKANGMALDIEGNLLVCEQVTSCLVRFRPGGERELVAYHHEGHYLNSPNDVVVRASDGGIYFTDPDYGRWNDWIGQERTRDLDFRGLWRVPHAGGAVELLSPATSSTSPTACASHLMSAASTSTTLRAATSRCSTSPATER